MHAELDRRLQAAEILFLDVDGVLTDGRIHFLDDGSQFRSFHVADGLGIRRLLEHGVEVVVVSSGNSESVVHRCRQLGIQHVFQEVGDKKRLVESFLTESTCAPSRAAFMGDDVSDLEAMRHVGLALAPRGAHPAACAAAHHTTAKAGGEGAVREVCDLILARQTGKDGEDPQ